MEEFMWRAIERVGFPIAVSVVSFYAVYKLFMMREKDRDAKNDGLIVATVQNTSAITGLSETITNKFGAGKDIFVCKYDEISEREKRHDDRNVEQTKMFKEELEKLRAKNQ